MDCATSDDGDASNYIDQEEKPQDADIIVSTHEETISKQVKRGFLSSLCLIGSIEDSKGFSPKIKNLIVFQVAASAMMAPMGGAIILPSIDEICKSLDATESIVNISYGIYMLALGIFPLWWSAASEQYGRRGVYLISFSLYAAFCIGTSLSQNIGQLMVFRVLSGGAAASVQAVGAGTIGDIYIVSERGRAIGYYYLGPLMGPLVAPIIGGLITQRWGWRGSQWFLVICAGVILAGLILLLPETLNRPAQLPITNSVAEGSGSDSLEKVSGTESRTFGCKRLGQFKSDFFFILKKPLSNFRFMSFPPVALSIIYSSYCYFTLYMVTISIQIVYSDAPYNFGSIIVGLMYIPNSIGYMISSILSGRYSDKVIKRGIVKNNGEKIPEERIAEHVYFGAALYPASLLIFGWTAYYRLFWFIPLIGTFLFGISSMIIFGTTMTYLVDTLPGHGSSGVALNNFFRMILAAVATFVAEPAIQGIGIGWLFTILTILGFISSFLLFAIKKWGTSWRQNINQSFFEK